MKRRLEIARSLLHIPKIIFLDEPTLGLDPQTRNQLWSQVKKLNEEERVTVFLTTHYMEEADRVANRIAIIDHGSIVAQGTPAELKQQTEFTRRPSSRRIPRADRQHHPFRERGFRSKPQKYGPNVEEETMTTIYVLWLRQVKRYLRSKPRIIASLGQPLLYLLSFGFGFGAIFAKAGQGNYIQFLAPGMIGMTILFTSIFSGIELMFDRQFGFLKEMLVAPQPRILLMIGRTLGGATTAIFQGVIVIVVCLLAGFRPTNYIGIPIAFGYMVLISVLFTALGTAIACSLNDMQGFQMVMNFLVMPIYFLSGALFPLTNIPAVMKFFASIDPLSYGVDGMRGALIGRSVFGGLIDVAVLSVLTLIFLAFGARQFSRIEA